MERIAFKMQLLPDSFNEYKKRHLEIWPEITALLKKVGVIDYSIFFDEETNILFASLKIEDSELLNALSKEEVMQHWWKYMSDITTSKEDGTPVLTSLKEMFYLA